MSLWGSAVWGSSTWPSLSVADLLVQPPAFDRGVPVGIGDWRLSVEVLLPVDGTSIWGVATWGESYWNTLGWVDITEHVRGIECSRGSDETYGRPRVGEASFTLDSAGDKWSPWNPSPPQGAPAFFACGTIIRYGIRSATDTRAGGWLPRFTGIVDGWTPSTSGVGADRFVTVTAVETLRDLATIDDNALPGLVGGGEDPIARIERLLEEALWPYGFAVEAQHLIASPGSYPLVSTDMASNRLAECYLVGDSCDAVFRSDRKGRALLTNVEYVGVVGGADPEHLPLVEFSSSGGVQFIGFDYYGRTVGGLRYVPYDADSFESTNSDDSIMNDARFARVGGTQQVFEQVASIARYGRRTLVRNDLITTSDAAVQLIAQYTTIRRALNTLRVSNVTVQVVDRSDEEGLVAIAADVQSFARVFPPDGGIGGNPPRPYVEGFVAGYVEQITPRTRSEVSWQISFAVDTRAVYRIPAAQLPATDP